MQGGFALMTAASNHLSVGAEELAQIGLFGGMPQSALQHFANELSLVQLKDGDVLFREGDSGRELYVVLTGAVDVVRTRRGQAVPVGQVGAGRWFGEGCVLAVQPRSATVAASGPVELLRLGASDLNALYRRDAKAYSLLVLNMARDLGRELRTLREQMLQSSGDGDGDEPSGSR